MSQNPGIGTNTASIQPVSTKTALTALSPTTQTVGLTSGQVVASNTSRKGLAIINLSTNVISLGFGANTAVLNSGITLTQYGSVWETSEYDFVTSAVNAIASLGSSVISIQEYQ